jgi:MFS family permease
MLNLALFKNNDFAVGTLTGWAIYVALIPIPVFLPFYLQNILGYRPDQIGIILASGPMTVAFVAPVAGGLSDRIGSRPLTTIGLMVVGLAILSMRSLTPQSTWWDVVFRLRVSNVGAALFTSPNSSAVMGAVHRDDFGIASGTVALVRNLGMVCGVAVAGAIITSAQPHFLAGLRGALACCAAVALAGALVSATRSRARTPTQAR